MSENHRAPPSGPRSSRDYDSGKSTSKFTSRDHDSYPPRRERPAKDSYKSREYDSHSRQYSSSFPKRDSYESSYSKDSYKSSSRGGYKSSWKGDSYRPSNNAPSSSTKPPPVEPESTPSSGGGLKRSLPPSEPSSYRKRREIGDQSEAFASAVRGRGRGGSASRGSSRGDSARGSSRGDSGRGGSRGSSRGDTGRAGSRGSFKGDRGGFGAERGSFRGGRSERGRERGTRGRDRAERGRGKPPARGGPANRGGRGGIGRNGTIEEHYPVDASPAQLAPSQIYSVKITRPSEVYKRVQQVGEGTYGKVYKATNVITDEKVALKKLRLETEREGFPITAMREIKLLQSFDHENIVGLLEMMVEHNQIYMVFDYMDHDLTGLLTHPDLKLEECHRKFIFKQLIEGLNYLHKKRVIHRDIKGSNILLDNVGRLKIADFGLARTMKIVKDSESPDYTNRVITIWYRPPELLMGSTDYGREVDVWGVGCLLIELYTKIAAFRGFDEVGQLCKIFNVMGTPSYEDWPDIEKLPWFEMMKPKTNIASKFKELFGEILTEHSFDLAQKLLALNPKTRLTTAEVLKHPYFTDEPQPAPLEFLKDIKGEWHEFETKKQRRKERKRIQDEEKAKKEEVDRLEADLEMQSEVQSETHTIHTDPHSVHEKDSSEQDFETKTDVPIAEQS